MKIAGTPIRVRGDFFLVAVFLGSLQRSLEGIVVWVAVCFFSVLLHELGHAFAGRAFGHTSSILIYAGGGLTTFDASEKRLGVLRDILVSLAGPCAGFVLGGLLFLIERVYSPFSPLAATAIRDGVWVNVGWGLVNLLPIAPLDGSCFSRHAFARLTPRTAERNTQVLSIAVALAAAAAAFSIEWPLGAMWALWRGASNARDLMAARAVAKDAELEATWDEIIDALTRRDIARAALLAEQSTARARTENGRTRSLTCLGMVRIAEERFDEVVRVVQRMPLNLDPAPWLTGIALLTVGRFDDEAKTQLEAGMHPLAASITVVAFERAGRERELAFLEPIVLEAPPENLRAVATTTFYAGLFATSLKYSERVFARTKRPTAAYNAACALCRMQRADDALVWLDRAATSGYRNVAELDADADLEAVRALPGYVDIRERIRQAGAPVT